MVTAIMAFSHLRTSPPLLLCKEREALYLYLFHGRRTGAGNVAPNPQCVFLLFPHYLIISRQTLKSQLVVKVDPTRQIDNRMRTNTSLPIPAFETIPGRSVPPSPQPPSSPSQRWNHLLQVEAALQLRFKNRKHVVMGKNGDDAAPTRRKIISLEEFYTQVKKLHLSTVVSTITHPADAPVSQDHPFVLLPCTEEQVLHDLLCISEPILYRMVETSAPNKSNSINNDNSTVRLWSLESVEFSGNRLLELKKLMQQLDQPSMDWSNKSNRIVHMIESYRQSQQQQQPQDAIETTTNGNEMGPLQQHDEQHAMTTSTSKAKTTFSEPYIHAGMSLEERVRARAAASNNRQLNVSTSATGTTDKEDSSLSSMLLACADALWSHARFIMSRYQTSLRYRLLAASSSSKQKSAVHDCCIMTLKDVVDVLSRTTHNQQAAAAASRRQMVDAVQQLSQLAPEWIILSDPQGDRQQGRSNNEGRPRLSKQTTVWIKSVDYGVIRSRLGGTSKNNSADAAVSQPPIKLTVASTPSSDLKTAIDKHSNRKSPDSSMWQVTPATKRARTQIDPPTAPVTAGKHDQNDVTMRGSNQASATSASSPAVVAKRHPPNNVNKFQRFRMGLRINKNLIFTDADYYGGELIEPTQFDSPRGLKRLFEQLNSGHRI